MFKHWKHKIVTNIDLETKMLSLKIQIVTNLDEKNKNFGLKKGKIWSSNTKKLPNIELSRPEIVDL